ncbi:MAG TPA: ABC transporter permease [Candidatus Merdiplasma excrementigallinarum]|uniref:ABC transporter permease n=1 Tax=Candidatus Merdiplasma excrementigallinarum TaxID=2840864 RepID=A0A9D1NZP7_9FIRM|nr:ABC transporter permease [Candidatus Merdiplasma excrementigallinarum]
MEKKQNSFQKFMAIPGMASVVTAFVGVVVLMIIFTIMNPNFIGRANLMPLSRSICPYLLVGIGQGIVCITGNIDLSIGSVLGMSAMISATLICNGVNPILAVIIDIIACLAVGIVNGVLVGKFKLPPFIGTLGTMTICRGIAQIVNGNYNTGDIGTAPLAQGLRDLFYYGRIGVIYYGVIITLIIWFIFNYIMNYTRTGRHIYAIGSNVDAARLSGVDVFKTTTVAYLISAFCSCVAGLVTMAAAGMGSMQAGMSYEMYGVAAAVIGGISTLGGSGLLVGVIAGASVWAILQSGLTLANVPVAMRNIIIGIIVVACVLFDIMRRNGVKIKKNK